MIRFTVLVGLSLALSVFASAQVPNTMNFQGYLASAAGAPISSTVQMTFGLYTSASGGTASWTETQTVSVTNGVYNVILGSTTPLSIDIPQQYYLGVVVGDDAEMTPRVQLASVMSALTLRHVTLSGSNSFVGMGAGRDNNNGIDNTFVGRSAGHDNISGSSNTFVGRSAGYKSNNGSHNTFVGETAGYSNTTGHSNTFLGNYAGVSNHNGYHNTFLGKYAGFSNTTGHSNTFVGNYAGHINTTGIGNVFIGRSAGYSETGSNRLYIDNSNTSTPLIYGEFDTNLLRVNGELNVTGAASKPGGGSWTNSSDQRLKDVQGPFMRGLEALAALQPVAYRYTAGNPLHLPSDTTYIGLLAQEVKQTVPEAVSEGQEGYLTLNNDPLLWTMLNAIKQLNAKNEALQAEVDTKNEALQAELKARNEALQAEVDVLRQEFVALKAQLNP